MNPTARYDLAIYAPLAGPLYAEGSGAGGAELQMTLLARSLARRGLRVAHIVFDCPNLPSRHEGIDLVVEPARISGRLRATHGMLSTLARADARVYLQRSAGYETGIMAAFARSLCRPSVFSTSSTADLTLDRTDLVGISRGVYRAGVNLVTEVVTQTDEQVILARRIRSREAVRIRSFCEIAQTAPKPREFFLWIGGFIDYKRPLLFVELAERIPEARFVMVGGDRGADWSDLKATVMEAAARAPNLEIWPTRSRAELLPLYERAVAVVNTSRFEGMPNTLLEGWARGAPALSLDVDPDGVIARHALGHIAYGSRARLATACRSLWIRRKDPVQHLGIRRYIADHHDVDVVADEWMVLIEGLLRLNNRRCARRPVAVRENTGCGG